MEAPKLRHFLDCESFNGVMEWYAVNRETKKKDKTFKTKCEAFEWIYRASHFGRNDA
jgi:hypothetical protein